MSVVASGVTTVLATSAELAEGALIFAALCGGAVFTGWPAQADNTRDATNNATALLTRVDKRRECLPSVSRSAGNPTWRASKNSSRPHAIDHCFSGISPENTHLHRRL